ncbi:sugar MFS transporter [Rhodocaloribacter litoris]|uniref:sugar MFS transporter n=1 Tax=Rhodocaloribacter litoris TaxID=2558931 RepID=UPI001423B515|nr:sugar MFS transporter [Rhodocaloribacter litoris]QXD15373.1 sugar MFS transporter [Rhodocaloribacter litoris]
MQRNLFIVGLILLIFFVISFLTNIIGPLVPEIIEDFDLSLTLVAVLPFAFFIAYGVMSIPSGLLVERIGEKKTMVGAFGVAFVGALVFALFPNYLVAVVSLFLIGSGMAALQVAINPLLRAAGGEEHFAFNSVLGQLFFGLASFLSPLVYSYLVLNLADPVASSGGILGFLSDIVPSELPWISLYWIFALVSAVMVVIIAGSRFPAVERKVDEQVGALATHLKLLKNPIVVLYFLAIFAYVGTEQGVANWISEFLSSYHGYDPQTVGARTVSFFWGAMTAGTLLGLLMLKFIDSRRVLIWFTLGAIVALTAGLFGSGAMALVAFPAVGFFASVMWSIVFSLALNSMDQHHGSFSGILVTGIVGGAVVPLIVGWLGDLAGLRYGMIFLYATLGYILSVGFWAKPLVTNKTIDLSRKKITRKANL